MTILAFRDLDAVGLAVAAGLVPPAVAAAPARLRRHPSGGGVGVAVEFDAKLTKKQLADLERVGAARADADPKASSEAVSSWLELLPLKRGELPPLTAQTAVLFELGSPSDLPLIAGEMLRLGNDRQSVRGLTLAGGSGESKLLVRVVNPPYYTLIRALDPSSSGTERPLVAYLEAAPRVWVEAGYSHPFAAQIQAPPEQALLIRHGTPWQTVPEAPFRDIYEILNFALPSAPEGYAESAIDETITVPLKLVAGNAAELPELWVLDEPAQDQLDRLVRDADDRLVGRLKFAAATGPDGRTVIVLRTISLKGDPPILPLSGVVGYRPYHKLANLYLPVGTRLHPTLRRDAVRRLLADNPDALVWLAPGESGQFTPTTVPEDSFRPLEQWVEYVIDRHAEPLSAWVEATRFEFQSFLCGDAGESKAPKPPGAKADAGRKAKGRADPDKPLEQAGRVEFVPAPGEPDVALTGAAEPAATKPPGEWLLRRQELEKRFLGAEGNLDSPERASLWAPLAEANAGYGDVQESAVCWLNSFWPRAELSSADALSWHRAESGRAEAPKVADLDALLGQSDPTGADVRRALAAALWFAAQPTQVMALKERAPSLGRFLDANEQKVPVRAAWLAHARLAALNGNDTLGLARVRDRLLQRLLEEGLRPERDLPFFLRNAGHADSERLRAVRDQMARLHDLVTRFTAGGLKSTAGSARADQVATFGYIDYLFAFGMARLGEVTPARAYAESGRKILAGLPPETDAGVAGRFLSKAFAERVEVVLDHRPLTTPWSAELLAEFRAVEAQYGSNKKNDNPAAVAFYAITRVRHSSQILEPTERLDPYADMMLQAEPLLKALGEVRKQRDPAQLARSVRDLYRNGVAGKATADSRFLVLHNALSVAGRAGEAFTVELLNLVPETLRAAAAAPQDATFFDKQRELLARGITLAGYFDRREIVQQLIAQVIAVGAGLKDDNRYRLVSDVVPQAVRALRKLGLRDETELLLSKTSELVLGPLTPAKLRERHAAKPNTWADVLQSLLALAGGWLALGNEGRARPTLDLARQELIGPGGAKFPVKKTAELLQAYVQALGFLGAGEGLAAVAELFERFDPARVTNGYSSAPAYSRFHFEIAEQVVLAMASDDTAGGPGSQRWLQEDEFLVRRRVHADLRAMLAAGGF